MKLAGHPLYRADLEAAADWPGLEALRGATVLVTGATGLIGACLTDALAWANRTRGLGVRVIALCRNGGRARERFDGADGVSVAQADLSGDCGELPAADSSSTRRPTPIRWRFPPIRSARCAREPAGHDTAARADARGRAAAVRFHR